MPVNTSGLTARQERFVREYLVDGNATQAAVRAGYSEASAPVQGHRLLKNENVADAIAAGKAALADRLDITAENVAAELAKLAFHNPLDYVGKLPDDLTDDQAAAIVECHVTTDRNGNQVARYKLADKRQALVDLGKHLGMFRDRVELNATVSDDGPTDRALAMAVLTMVREAGGELQGLLPTEGDSVN